MRRLPWRFSYAKEPDTISGIHFRRHVFALLLFGRIYSASFSVVKLDDSLINDNDAGVQQ